MTQRIVRWDNNAVLWEGEAETVKDALHAALRAAVNCYRANLRGADLGGADLGGADLRDADLGGADLRDADLGGADLRDADLGGADLGGANLRGADLGGADLRDANLRDANLELFRDDLWAVISSAPAEVPALIAALKEGRVNGSTYTGECACLVGTIANARHCGFEDIPGLHPNSRRPAEQWFMGIKPGDTAEGNLRVKHAIEWAEEWYARMQAAFAPTAA